VGGPGCVFVTEAQFRDEAWTDGPAFTCTMSVFRARTLQKVDYRAYL